MIITAITILIVVLVVANLSGMIYNSIRPPCNDPIDEYILSAKRISKNISSELDDVVVSTQARKRVVRVEGMKKKSPDDDSLKQAVDKMFSSNRQDTEEPAKAVNEYNGANTAIFEIEMEGLKAQTRHGLPTKVGRPSMSINQITTDGTRSMQSGW